MGSLVKLPHGHLMWWQNRPGGHAVVFSCCFTSQQTCNGYLRDRPCPASPQTDLGAMLLFFLLASHPSNMQRVPLGQTLSCFTPNRPGDHAVVLFLLLHIPATCKGYLRDRPCPKTIVYAATLREMLQVKLSSSSITGPTSPSTDLMSGA